MHIPSLSNPMAPLGIEKMESSNRPCTGDALNNLPPKKLQVMDSSQYPVLNWILHGS